MRSIERLMPWIRHIQIADNPGRHEPGTRRDQFRAAARAPGRSWVYDGHVGCEYIPASDYIHGSHLGEALPVGGTT